MTKAKNNQKRRRKHTLSTKHYAALKIVNGHWKGVAPTVRKRLDESTGPHEIAEWVHELTKTGKATRPKGWKASAPDTLLRDLERAFLTVDVLVASEQLPATHTGRLAPQLFNGLNPFPTQDTFLRPRELEEQRRIHHNCISHISLPPGQSRCYSSFRHS